MRLSIYLLKDKKKLEISILSVLIAILNIFHKPFVVLGYTFR